MGKDDFLDVPLEVKAEDIQEDGIFKGHGSLFNKTPDAYGDLVAKGAFVDSLLAGGRNKTGVAMLWQHQSDKIPGVWASMAEDGKGLKVTGALALKTSLGSDVYEILKLSSQLGTFKMGLSIGYDTILSERDDEKKIRTLTKVDLWELSIVTFPAKLGATVTQVKALDEAKTPREFEKGLRELGVSKSDALYITALVGPQLKLRESAGGEEELDEGVEGVSILLEGLKSINDDLDVFRQTKGMSGILDALKKVNV